MYKDDAGQRTESPIPHTGNRTIYGSLKSTGTTRRKPGQWVVDLTPTSVDTPHPISRGRTWLKPEISRLEVICRRRVHATSAASHRGVVI